MPQYNLAPPDYHTKLDRAEYLLRFEGREFRLVSGGAKELHALYTILDDWREDAAKTYQTVLRLCKSRGFVFEFDPSIFHA